MTRSWYDPALRAVPSDVDPPREVEDAALGAGHHVVQRLLLGLLHGLDRALDPTYRRLGGSSAVKRVREHPALQVTLDRRQGRLDRRHVLLEPGGVLLVHLLDHGTERLEGAAGLRDEATGLALQALLLGVDRPLDLVGGRLDLAHQLRRALVGPGQRERVGLGLELPVQLREGVGRRRVGLRRVGLSLGRHRVDPRARGVDETRRRLGAARP